MTIPEGPQGPQGLPGIDGKDEAEGKPGKDGQSINVITIPSSEWPPAPDSNPLNFYVRIP